MITFASSRVFLSEPSATRTGFSDLDLLFLEGQWQLVATNAVTQTVNLFDLTSQGSLVETGLSAPVTNGQFPASDLHLIEIDNGLLAVFSGAGTALYTSYQISAEDGFGEGFTVTPNSGLTSAITAIASVQLSARQVLVTSQDGQEGLTVQRVGSAQPPALVQNLSVTGASFSDIATAEIADKDLILALDQAQNRVLSFDMDANGALSQVDSLGVPDGLGMVAPGILRITEIAGKSYGIIGADTSSSISVFEITSDGQMIARDHVIDGQDMRFAGVSELEIVETGGRAFILAAGKDDGLSLMELMPDGRILHHVSVKDSNAISLRDVSSLTGRVVDGKLQIFASSEVEAGLTKLVFDLGPMGNVYTGGDGLDTLTGGADDDLLFGGDDNDLDRLSGGGGDDILVAGDGNDQLEGGAGRDIFVLGNAVAGTRITDFNSRADTLDLSGWFELYGINQLQFFNKGNRLDIGFQEHHVTLYSSDGSQLTASAVADRIVINRSHSLPWDMPDDDRTLTHIGAGGYNVMFGHAGKNIFRLGNGEDICFGGEGFDTVIFESTTQGVTIDLMFPQYNAGGASRDRYHLIDALQGSAYRDEFKGTLGDNLLTGGDGDDVLKGRDGADTLRGGTGDDLLVGGLGTDDLAGDEGNDQLWGKDHNDTLNGGAGDDYLNSGNGEDSLDGGIGDDILIGDIGHDTLNGGDGNDSIGAGRGHDVLNGGAGNDFLNGYRGRDTMDGGTGDDSMLGGDADDLMEGGAGNDTLIGNLGNDLITGGEGQDSLRGGWGDDTLEGGAGNDTLGGVFGDDWLEGGIGDDILIGDIGHDTLNGDDGNDSIEAGRGHDVLNGGAGNDFLNGHRGRDTMDGGTGDDSMLGGDADDLMVGGAGNDTLIGNLGNDLINGGEGQDSLRGGWGDDTLEGGAGNDTLEGVYGADTFVFSGGQDVINDFSKTEDIILLDQLLLSDPSMTGQEIIARHGVDLGPTVMLEFGLDGDANAPALILSGVDSLAGLDSLIFVT